jgi:hypothetical protein
MFNSTLNSTVSPIAIPVAPTGAVAHELAPAPDSPLWVPERLVHRAAEEDIYSLELISLEQAEAEQAAAWL